MNIFFQVSGKQLLEQVQKNSSNAILNNEIALWGSRRGTSTFKHPPPEVWSEEAINGRSLNLPSSKKDIMEDSSAHVFDRLKKALSIASDVELAERLGVSKSGLNGYRVRDTIPFAQIVELCKKESMSLDWILLGQGLRLGEDAEILEENDRDKLERQIAVYEDLLQYAFSKLKEYESDSWQGPESVLNQLRNAALS
tara:strand:- start:1694 stop:2284 length:591 start_codon:yes stop_codon:yes gene_type:complete